MTQTQHTEENELHSFVLGLRGKDGYEPGEILFCDPVYMTNKTDTETGQFVPALCIMLLSSDHC